MAINGWAILAKHVAAETLDMDAFDAELDSYAEYQKAIREDTNLYYKNLEEDL